MINRRTFLRTVFVLSAGLTTVGLAGCAKPKNVQDTADQSSKAAPEQASQPQVTTVSYPLTLQDFLDKQVVIPAQTERVVTLVYPSFSRLLFFGEAKRVVMTARFDPTEWTRRLYPEVDKISPVTVELADARKPNVEELAALKPDLVYYWAKESETYQAIEKLGINILAAYPQKSSYDTVPDWIREASRELELYAQSLGGEAIDRARDWAAYFAETVAMVQDRLKGLTEADRKSVYYARQDPDGLQAFAYNSYCRHVVEVAGGYLVTADPQVTKGFDRFTLEQIIEWNPEVIVMGWLNSTEAVTDNPQWAGIRAVQNKQVHLLPGSVNLSWPHDVELPLAILHMAMLLHPDKMQGIDLVAETIAFHKRFRKVEISQADARAMLERKDPPAA